MMMANERVYKLVILFISPAQSQECEHSYFEAGNYPLKSGRGYLFVPPLAASAIVAGISLHARGRLPFLVTLITDGVFEAI